jgi:hypothetical protein
MDAIYNIEGVMTNFAGGWLLALDQPYQGEDNDTLALVGTQPAVIVRVRAIVPQEGGTARDIVIGPVADLYDSRLLVGRKLSKVEPAPRSA